jgi:hypothetical protein
MSHAVDVGRARGSTDANTNTIPVEGEEPIGVIFNLLIRSHSSGLRRPGAGGSERSKMSVLTLRTPKGNGLQRPQAFPHTDGERDEQELEVRTRVTLPTAFNRG